jgi:HK97 family phage major capsid protein
MNTTTERKGRYGQKDAGSTPPAVPAPNQGETQDQFLARCKGLKITDADAQAAWAKANPTKPAPAAGDNEMSIDQVTDAIKGIVEAQFKAANQTNLTAEAIRQIIADELAKQQGDSKKLSLEQVKAAAEAASKAVADANRKSTPNPRQAADAGRAGGLIEVPYSLTKGNLPPHFRQLSNCLLGKALNEGLTADELDVAKKASDRFWGDLAVKGTKALTSTGDGTGADWVPRDLTSELYRRLYLESQIAQAFLAGEVQMPTNPYDYPLLTTDPEFKLNNVQNTTATASDLGTSKFTLTAQRLMALCQFSYEADEDGIIPLLPVIQQTLGRAAARALEHALINGDTTATHFDTGETVATNDVRRAWKGLRRLATDGSLLVDFATGGIARSNLIALVKLMGKWGVRTQDLLWIVGPKAWATMLALDEVALAYARGGASSYIQGGPTPAPWGGSIVVSEQVAENLNANAVFDNSTTTKGQIILLNKAGFVMGSRREFMVEVDRNIRTQTHDVVASFRKAFQPVETPSTTISTVAVARNYAA